LESIFSLISKEYIGVQGCKNREIEFWNLLSQANVLLIFSVGLGPLAVRAARKGAYVIANDLNPSCY
jgi:hypothetical protein